VGSGRLALLLLLHRQRQVACRHPLRAETACRRWEEVSSTGASRERADRRDTIPSLSTRAVVRAPRGCKATTRASDSRAVVRAKRSRCCRRNAEWPRRGNGSCAITTRSSNTTEVSLRQTPHVMGVLTDLAAVSGVKTDRALSPNTMSEGDRRELIARQHRALYGDNSALYNADGSPVSHPPSQDARVTGAGHGSPPSALDRFGVQAQPGADGAVQMPPRDRTNLTASPVSTQPTQQSFGRLNDAQQSSRTSNSSSGGSPPLGHGVQKGSSAAGIIPIGTRPTQPPSSAGGGLNKRSTTPLTPSSLSHGFSSAAESQSAAAAAHVKDERSASAASNPALADKSVGGLGGWGSNSAVWGAPKTTLAVQPSVWG